MDNKEQDTDGKLEVLSVFVRLGVLCWSGCILTLAYIQLPSSWGIPEQKFDNTFIAGCFTTALASFGLQTANNKKSISKDDIERLMASKDQKTDNKVD